MRASCVIFCGVRYRPSRSVLAGAVVNVQSSRLSSALLSSEPPLLVPETTAVFGRAEGAVTWLRYEARQFLTELGREWMAVCCLLCGCYRNKRRQEARNARKTRETTPHQQKRNTPKAN